MVVHLRSDGSAERVEARRRGDADGGGGWKGDGSAGRDDVECAESAAVGGDVGWGEVTADEPLRQAQGEAGEGRAAFDKKGHPEHVVMTGAVHLQERVRASDAAGGTVE